MSSYNYLQRARGYNRLTVTNQPGIWNTNQVDLLSQMFYDRARGVQNNLYDELIQNYKFLIDILPFLIANNVQVDNFDLEANNMQIANSYDEFHRQMNIMNASMQENGFENADAYVSIRANIYISYAIIANLGQNISSDYNDLFVYHYLYVRLMDNDYPTSESLYDPTSSVEQVVKFQNSANYTMSIMSNADYPSITIPPTSIIVDNIVLYNQQVAQITSPQTNL